MIWYAYGHWHLTEGEWANYLAFCARHLLDPHHLRANIWNFILSVRSGPACNVAPGCGGAT